MESDTHERLDRDQLQQIVDLLPVGIAVVDASGRTTLRNRATYEIFSEERSDSLTGAMRVYEMYHPDGARYALADVPLSRSLRGEVVRGEEMVIRGSPRGRDLVLLVNSAPLHGPDGEIVAAMSVFQDITALKTRERDQLEFFAIANHEIRTPAAAIKGLLQLARRSIGRRDERIPSLLERAEIDVDRLVKLTDDLLDVSRMLVGRHEGERRRLDLRRPIEAAIERVAPTSQRHEIRPVLPDVELWVFAEEGRLTAVLENLLTNAIKYSAGGEIVVEAEVASLARPEARVRVRDGGIGIPAADAEKIFEPFYRSSRGREQSGAGLGLYLSKQIVDEHGGRLWLEESSESGSVFAFALPLERRAVARV